MNYYVLERGRFYHYYRWGAHGGGGTSYWKTLVEHFYIIIKYKLFKAVNDDWYERNSKKDYNLNSIQRLEARLSNALVFLHRSIFLFLMIRMIMTQNYISRSLTRR